MNILIMGGPGAGKGTMSSKIVEKFNVNHISTGDIFRSEISNKTELGNLAQSYMDKGLLVPDEVVNNMVKSYLDKLEDKKNGFLLDGYPRTLDQAKAFDALSQGTDLAIDKVIAMEIDFNELASRVTGRRLCKECGEIYHITNHPSQVEGVCDKCGGALYQREDESEEAVKIRLDTYNKQTRPLIDYYTMKGSIININGDQPMEDVFKDIEKSLEGK